MLWSFWQPVIYCFYITFHVVTPMQTATDQNKKTDALGTFLYDCERRERVDHVVLTSKSMYTCVLANL